MRQASEQAKEAAETEGFFSATVDVAVDRSVTPFNVTVRVTPGPQATVKSAQIAIDGIAANDSVGAAARACRAAAMAAAAGHALPAGGLDSC